MYPSDSDRTTSTTRRSIGSRCWWLCLLLVLLVLSLELTRHQAEANNIHRRFYRRAVRLCSRSLSDALYLLCKDRGYNEPFTSSETEVRHTTGPGLVEECCYNSCSIEQMEQYCKPRNKA
ncbi:insulin-like growth factor I [Nasonia vitripennis]|uniref:Insulin-like domain-containing protein n=1 Tax=Nasonia vitripennis TaxID=7425 RepID=A0A7M7GLJ6_NASVI|nr:insulin-like growth factor I [Nasonia vitripennis]